MFTLITSNYCVQCTFAYTKCVNYANRSVTAYLCNQIGSIITCYYRPSGLADEPVQCAHVSTCEMPFFVLNNFRSLGCNRFHLKLTLRNGICKLQWILENIIK